MIKAIPMEDWLRGCVYHDGKHGEVTLPTDKVLQIANYIQRTRKSISDGLIDLAVEPYIAGKHADQIVIDEIDWKDQMWSEAVEQTEPFFRNPTEEEKESVNKYIESISVPTGVNTFDVIAEQTERSE